MRPLWACTPSSCYRLVPLKCPAFSSQLSAPQILLPAPSLLCSSTLPAGVWKPCPETFVLFHNSPPYRYSFPCSRVLFLFLPPLHHLNIPTHLLRTNGSGPFLGHLLHISSPCEIAPLVFQYSACCICHPLGGFFCSFACLFSVFSTLPTVEA